MSFVTQPFFSLTISSVAVDPREVAGSFADEAPPLAGSVAVGAVACPVGVEGVGSVLLPQPATSRRRLRNIAGRRYSMAVLNADGIIKFSPLVWL